MVLVHAFRMAARMEMKDQPEYPAWEAAEDKSIGFCNKQCYKRKIDK